MPAPVPNYFDWLLSHLGDTTSYSRLLTMLDEREFEWFIPHDDNRGEDGKELRDLYTNTFGAGGEDLQDIGASVLEVLIALARRLEDDTEVSAADWFWKLIQNLNLHNYIDQTFNTHVEEEVDHCLTILLTREFGYDGNGGLFPLRRAQHDQRRVEIWYQMQAYLLESDYVNNWP